jgi:alginate production protein
MRLACYVALGCAVCTALLSGIAAAQFQLPAPAAGADPATATAAAKLPQRLTYQWAIGSESDAIYRTDPDLDKRVRDNSLILSPQLNGYVTYRPNDRVEATLEMILEREWAAREQHTVQLPNGETLVAPKRGLSLIVDQAFVRYRVNPGFEVLAGRRNFEDDRHWLYDTSLDVVHARLRRGFFTLEASTGRKDMVDGDLLRKANRTQINNHMLFADYRGFEDHKLGAYAIIRDDRSRREGRPRLTGLQAIGSPNRNLNYWVDVGWLRGRDELQRRFSGRAIDAGATYRFLLARYFPNVTLSYANGSGDSNADDTVNHEFRQTGLHSNERRLAGVAKFKLYGEALDPDVSNLRILTAGFGFIPTQNVTVDLLHHRYRLNELADEVRNSAITAQMNQVDTALSRDVGRGYDLVIGIRSLFGLRRLGMDLRAGMFRPGRAFLRNVGDDENPDIRRADRAYTLFAKFWWIW